MVLTITLVNGNGGQQAPAPSDSQEMQWSPNDLAQLMSGQTLTGLLNPDGTITLNSHLIPAQHQPHQHQHHQMDSVHSHLSGGMQPISSSMASSGAPLNNTTTTVGQSNTSFQYCRGVKLETNLPTTNSLNNIHAISTGDLSNMNIINSNNNNNNNDIISSALISQSQQSQSGSQVQMQNKKGGQKRLTAKQKQAIQEQQLQQNQQTEPLQSLDARQPQQMNALNSDQVGLRPHQPQVVATVQLPNGQIGQLIAPSGGFWSPNALDLQQLSMAVAAATGAMPQTLSLPINSGQNAMQISNSNQQQLHIANDHQTQLQQSSSQLITTSQSHEGSLSQNSGSTLSISRSHLSTSNQRGNQLQFHNGNFQIAQQQNQLHQTSIQASVPQQQSSSHQTNQSLSSVSPHNESDSGPLSNQQGKKLKRLACTCPNCRDGDNSRGGGGGGDKKKQHICHFADCNKVYGKTSHLRAHLRWHSGERPYICSWAFCGKKFTRSDELQRHRRTHTGEKRFQCQECNKRFMRSDHLSKHLKIHLSSKKCGSTSQQSPLLNSTQTF